MSEDQKPIFVVFTESEYDWITEGRFYKVNHADFAGDPEITDDDGDPFDSSELEDSMIEIYEGDVVKARFDTFHGFVSPTGLTEGGEYTIRFSSLTTTGESLLSFYDDDGGFHSKVGLFMRWNDIRKISNDYKEDNNKGIMKFRVNSPEHSEKVQEAFGLLGYEFPCGKVPQFTAFKYYIAAPKGTIKGCHYNEKSNILLVGPSNRSEFDEHEGKEIDVSWLDPNTFDKVKINGKLYNEHEVSSTLERLGIEPVE